MMVRGKWLVAGLMMAVAMPLAGCRDNPQAKADLKPLDDGLTEADPAVKGALEDKIMVDPKLTGQANRNAGNPAVNGAVARAGGILVRLAGQFGIDHDLVFERTLDGRVGIGQPVVERLEVGLGLRIVAASRKRHRRRHHQARHQPFPAHHHR